MATDAQSLMAVAKCYQCYGASSAMLDLLELGLLKKLVEDDMADTSAQALLAAANCYNCYAASPFMLQLLKLGLLLQLNTGTGTGGLTFTDGVGPPAIDGSITTQGYRDVTDPNFPVLYLNTAWPVTAAPVWDQI